MIDHRVMTFRLVELQLSPQFYWEILFIFSFGRLTNRTLLRVFTINKERYEVRNTAQNYTSLHRFYISHLVVLEAQTVVRL